MDYNVAVKARLKGCNGMTRLSYGSHVVKGNNSILLDWLRSKDIFVEFRLIRNEGLTFYRTDAVVISDGRNVHTVQDPNYYKSLETLLHLVLNDMPDTKVRMK